MNIAVVRLFFFEASYGSTLEVIISVKLRLIAVNFARDMFAETMLLEPFLPERTPRRGVRSRIILCKSARPPTSQFVQTDCFQSKFNWNISERWNLMKESNVVSLSVDVE